MDSNAIYNMLKVLKEGNPSKKFALKKFDITKVRGQNTSLIIGKRNCGKSFLVRDILYQIRDYEKGIIINPTEPTNPSYDYMPTHLVLSNYSVGEINEVCAKMNAAQQIIPKPSFMVFDDCLADEIKDTNLPGLKLLLKTEYEAPLNIIMTQQYPIALPRKSVIDYVFIMRTPIVSDRNKIYQLYGGIFPSFKTFCECLDACTDNYECLVLKLTSVRNTHRFEDSVFWYKPVARENFKLCQNAMPPLVEAPPVSHSNCSNPDIGCSDNFIEMPWAMTADARCFPKGTLGYVMDNYERNADFKMYVDAYVEPMPAPAVQTTPDNTDA